ncbi:IclR family transcriptional regulator C-terminal domain-containing protein [Microbacterium oryzae]|uniref:Glycerol operon regulatory protein n=1 Tax=Microbacterium oryzae TaxID=743009 RepID=A0A6I6DTE8_9MICO|nr:IclR family transcriptional regulator C-terminal domain-containing protein [Microbacterium oryzae]QGU28285.1 IclR family transcriptional regulator [Microbacterium oryzae]
MSENEPEELRGDFVQSFARGLAVIRAFDGEHPRLTLSDVAVRAEVPRAAARRFLRTLEVLGYVRSTGREFALTPRVLELGFSYLSALSLPEVVQPHLEALSRRVDESVSAAVLDGADIVYVARVPTHRIMSVAITIGTRFPAHATSMGQVLLAQLPEAERERILAGSALERLTDRTITTPGALAARLDAVREQGYEIVDGELESGVRSVAAPVRGRDGTVVAAVNVSASAARVSVEQLRTDYLPALLDATAAIQADLRLV